MIKKIEELINKIVSLQTKDEIVDLTVEISFEIQKLSQSEIKQLKYDNNFYIKTMFDILNSKIFESNLIKVLNLKYDKNIDYEKALVEEKQILQLLLNLIFFTVSVVFIHLDDENILFIKRHFSRSLFHLQRNISLKGYNFSAQKIALNLERISFGGYTFKKETTLDVDFQFLHRNKVLARILCGKFLLNWISYNIPRAKLNIVIEDKKHPNNYFQICKHIVSRSSLYKKENHLSRYNLFGEDTDSVILLLNKIEDKNMSDVLFISSEIGLDNTDEANSMSQKIELSKYIYEKLQERFEKLSFFESIDNDKESASNWSNKVFINSFRFLSVLVSISKSRNVGWQSKVFNFFYRMWLKDLYDIFNFYTLREDENIIIFVEGESDKIILENAYKMLYPGQNTLSFYEAGGSKEINSKLNSKNIQDYQSVVFGIYDFDSAFNDFNGLRLFGDIEGDEKSCLYRERTEGIVRMYALLLPVPEDRKTIASMKYKDSSRLSIEMLFNDNILESNNNLEEVKVLGGSQITIFKETSNNSKVGFAKKTNFLHKEDFVNFVPLFEKIFELNGLQSESNPTEKLHS
jgi:hypothetical protein